MIIKVGTRIHIHHVTIDLIPKPLTHPELGITPTWPGASTCHACWHCGIVDLELLFRTPWLWACWTSWSLRRNTTTCLFEMKQIPIELSPTPEIASNLKLKVLMLGQDSASLSQCLTSQSASNPKGHGSPLYNRPARPLPPRAWTCCVDNTDSWCQWPQIWGASKTNQRKPRHFQQDSIENKNATKKKHISKKKKSCSNPSHQDCQVSSCTSLWCLEGTV